MTTREPLSVVASARRPRGPIGRLLDLFSSIWLGVFLLSGLFVYSSIGSSGVPTKLNIFLPEAWVSVREVFDRSEFEWFHWWPFNVLIALICTNLVVATIRRIPFNVVNLGVWMIHSGIIILALGSVWYFGTKVEGDTFIARRQIIAELPGHASVSFVASPGNRVQLGEGENAYTLLVSAIDPDWELLSGDDKGQRAYKVSVLVQSPTQMFIRELLAGYPQYTEDLVPSDDSDRPVARARKTLGKPLVDEELRFSLEYHPQDYFYLMESAAVYLREVGQIEWVQRPIENLPRFNDRIAAYDHVWPAPGDALPPIRPTNLSVPSVEDGDPLPDVTFHIGEYLRYASMWTRRLPNGDRLNPWVMVRFQNNRGDSQDFELLALDPDHNSLGGGVLEFHWARSLEQIEALKDVRPPMLHIKVPAASISVDEPITETVADDENIPFTVLEGSDYSYRVVSLQSLPDRNASLAIVEIKQGDRKFIRWVFDDPALSRDLPADGDISSHAQDQSLDDNIRMVYEPGRRASIRLVAGPDEGELRLLLPSGAGVSEQMIQKDEAVPVREDITLTVLDYAQNSRAETRPAIVPLRQRDPRTGMQASMIRLNVAAGASVESLWLPYHVYPFARREEALSRFPYDPTVVHLPDGQHVEILFSRERMKLPYPVALHDFRIDTHIGGFTGQTSSILDWTSIVSFKTESGWTDPAVTEVHMNDPVEFGGLWYYQLHWDAPAPGSAGLNYTVLGVANRHGVMAQLLGCCLAVIGMVYAFYVKPYVKRRRQRAVYAQVAAARDLAEPVEQDKAHAPELEMVSTGGEKTP